MMRKTLLAAAAAAALAAPAFAMEEKTLVETAQGAGTFETLLAAAEAAGLVETLAGPGPYTLFAPTDRAFEKLPEGTVESLLLEENRDQLVDILTYHVVPGTVMSSDLTDGLEATAVNDGTLTFTIDGGAFVNDIRIDEADIEASNGVIHIVESVILPAE